MLPSVKPALDPFSQRAAIDALEAQRSAYQRYARTVDDQTRTVGTGDADAAVTAAGVAARGFDALDTGARALRPHLDLVRANGSPDQQDDVQRRLATLASDADRAQTAIQNLTSQLDAWRLAYGRQLAAVGLTPGSGGSPAAGSTGMGSIGTGSTGTGSTVGGTTSNNGDGSIASSRPYETGAQDSRSYGPRGQTGSGRPVPSLLNRLG